MSFTQCAVFFSTPIRTKCAGAIHSFLCAFLVHYWLTCLSLMNTSALLHWKPLNQAKKKKKNHQNLLCSLHQLSKFPSPYVSFHVYVFHSSLSLYVLEFNMIISHKALEVLMFTRRLYLVSVGSCQVQILSCESQKLCCGPQRQHPHLS